MDNLAAGVFISNHPYVEAEIAEYGESILESKIHGLNTMVFVMRQLMRVGRSL